MSYDLALFAPKALTVPELSSLIREIKGLQVDQAGTGFVTVVRGERRRYSFTVGGPNRVEAEDVPPDVQAVVLGARYLYEINVEGAAATEIAHAVRFGRLLARTLDGAVVDQQLDEVWSRPGSRAVRKPEKQERVAAVHVYWYCLKAELDSNPADLLIQASERLLPECLPRRYGEYEPFQGKYADAGADGFRDAWADATSLLFTSGVVPCLGGFLSPGPSERVPDGFWSMNLTFLAEPLRHSAWSESLRRLFVEFCDSLPAFYAQAEVTRGHIWSGRTLWADSETETPLSPVRARQGWMGLPPKPMWWSWFGPPFAEVAARLPAEARTATKRGIFHVAASEPIGGDVWEPVSRWLPGELFARFDSNPRSVRPAPLIPAAVIPEELAKPLT